jgi:hypothetical protein
LNCWVSFDPAHYPRKIGVKGRRLDPFVGYAYL